MYLDSFHTSQGQSITITPEQGSQFAKQVSDDFNPLHNPDSKRFCVPGDLLFALVLAHYGLSKSMVFKYTGMVGKGVVLNFLDTQAAQFAIADTNDKPYLEVTRDGDTSHNMSLIEAFSRAYVAFSGHSFPHILVPLMQQKNVMINPDKPMVIYESMAFGFDDLSAEHPSLELTNSSLDVNGKRGLVRMEFDICESGVRVGSGYKTMVLSGLREFDQDQINTLIQLYQQTKTNHR
ncbi:MAG: DUF3581 domain-containing protein [Thiomicrospira sp.]|uniref:DUF3581 domain-containing protein n=1 Tax=Thiomicrospira sp. TaxID=935 RepID=UPI0019EAD06E|nr:DUF3581 domain-containing protein [Thiomicrospira sp.]MBE0492818.1 DUF3581 domain-containing protein [Thiomicrospira sp.]